VQLLRWPILVLVLVTEWLASPTRVQEVASSSLAFARKSVQRWIAVYSNNKHCSGENNWQIFD
jgi:hypothetical protein